jgi:tetratricopeptide (TPR) repeat protein
LKNVELIPVICPQCGSSMDVPGKMDKVHCMYCGTKFIVSEKQPDIHYHYHGEKKSIENYLRLAMRYIQEGRIQKSILYFDKAREVDMDKADTIIEKNSRNFAKLYLGAARKEIEEMRKRGRVDVIPNPDDDTFGRLFIEDDDLDRRYQAAEISKSRSERELKDLTFEARLALEEAEKFISEEMNDLRGALYHIRGEFHLRVKNLISGDYSMIGVQDKLARKYFKQAVKVDPGNADAIQKLVKLGDACKECWGNGECPHCHDQKICYNCNGKGTCKWCKGDGKIGLFGKQIKCIRCGGDGLCYTCKGDGKCHICGGSGNCPVCDGLRVDLRDR